MFDANGEEEGRRGKRRVEGWEGERSRVPLLIKKKVSERVNSGKGRAGGWDGE